MSESSLLAASSNEVVDIFCSLALYLLFFWSSCSRSYSRESKPPVCKLKAQGVLPFLPLSPLHLSAAQLPTAA